MRAILRKYKARRAVARAYAIFAARYPDYAAALFDEHFVQTRVTPLLATEAGAATLTAKTLATAWAAQFGMNAVERDRLATLSISIASAFLAFLSDEMASAKAVAVTR